MIKKLSEQINLEYDSSNVYLQMSLWCNYKGLDGCVVFLAKHAHEEREQRTNDIPKGKLAIVNCAKGALANDIVHSTMMPRSINNKPTD